MFCVLMAAGSLTVSAEPNIVVDDAFLTKALAELQAPRLMRLEDIHDQTQKQLFVADDYKFVIAGDFNKDGRPDYAIAGMYDSKDGTQAFVAVVSVSRDRLVVDYFRDFPHTSIVLAKQTNYWRGYDAIVVVFRIGTELAHGLIWNGKRYVVFQDRAELK